MSKINIYVEDPKAHLRELREKECFPVVNRGALWYERLSFEQKAELRKWYSDWLNVTDTLVVPKAPTWLNNTLTEEETVI